MTLEPVCRDVETAQGVPITVTGVAQVRIDEILKLGQIYLGKYKMLPIQRKTVLFFSENFTLQVKLMSDNEELLKTAAEQFLGKSIKEIQDTIIMVKTGHKNIFSYELKLYFIILHCILKDIRRTFAGDSWDIDC